MQEIHNKEKDQSSTEDAADALDPSKIKEKGVWAEHYEFDDQFKLPYGVGYDSVIKKRTDMVDK